MDLAERGIQRLIDYNKRMAALSRGQGDEANAQVYEMLLESFEKHPEHLPFFGMLLEGLLEEQANKQEGQEGE